MNRKMVIRNVDELPFGFSGCSTEFGIEIMAGAEEKIFEDENIFVKFFGPDYPGAFAYMEKDGSITVHNERTFEPSKEEMDRLSKDNKAIQKLKKWFFTGFVVLWILMIPSAFIHEYFPSLLMAIGFISLGCSKIAGMIYQYALRCMGSERMKQTHRYHSAEHATINAFYDLKRVPTLEEVKNYSNYSYYCGVVPKMHESLSYFVIGFCRLIPGFWYLIALAIVIPLIYIFRKKMYLFEYFSLLEPTDTEYKVAIAALEGALKHKELVDEVKNDLMGMIMGDHIPVAHFVIEVE